MILSDLANFTDSVASGLNSGYEGIGFTGSEGICEKVFEISAHAIN